MAIAVSLCMHSPKRTHEMPMLPRPRSRTGRLLLALILAASVSGVAVAGGQEAVSDSARGVSATVVRTLSIERVEFTGLTRTPAARALIATGLTLPEVASPEVIQGAADRLRASQLFRRVDVHTRAGARPGAVVLVFAVQETAPHLRFGLGYEDFSSWYLIPAQLNADNLTGHGEGLRLSTRFGYRLSGVDLVLRKPALDSARDFWELRARVEGIDRIYFLDSLETKHHIDRGGLDLRLGRSLSRTVALEGWLGAENTVVDSNASLYTDRASQGRSKGEQVPFSTLPGAIQRDVRDRAQTRVGLALIHDHRTGNGLEQRGVWARLSGEGVFSKYGDFGSWQSDVRGYAPLGRDVQLAVRLRAASLSSAAPFYERYYVGGLYTVRGYPSQALSPPQGHLNLGAGSLELRHVWAGSASDPRFTAIAFVDGGQGWSQVAPAVKDVAFGAGIGFRVRLPWLGQLGVDAARPLTPSPVREGFHLHGSLGWSF